MHNIKAFTRQTQEKIPIKKMVMPIMVQEIGTNKHITNEYAIVDVHFQGLQNGKPAVAILQREIYLVKDLKANFLIENNILGPEKIRINFEKGEAHMNSSQVTIPLSIENKSTTIHKPIHLKKFTVIPSYTVLSVPIYSLLAMSSDWNYIFELDEINFSLYAHMMNSKSRAVLVRNNKNRPIKISRNLHLRYITEMDYPNAYYTSDAFPTTTKINTNLNGVDVTISESSKVDFID